MKKRISLGRAITGLIFIIAGILTIQTTIDLIHQSSLPFISSISGIAFGVATILGGVAIWSGAK